MGNIDCVRMAKVLGIVLVGVSVPLGAAEVAAAPSSGGADAVVYRPPLRGAPSGRVGGGTRGVDAENWSLCVLAPEDAGLTVAAQPTLYWFTPRPIEWTVEVTVIRSGAAQPLLEVALEGPHAAGIHPISLARWRVTLEPEVDYEWFVSVVSHRGQGSGEQVVAGAMMRRVAAAGDVEARARRASQGETAAVYADAGFWYDAVDALARQIEADPGNRTLRKGLAGLMRQVGLEVPADGL